MSEPPPPPRQSNRVTMRTLAESAGVSVQAVSLALRNHPSIARETREKIQALARKAGYAPDPQLVKLMHHLRTTHDQKVAASVCALTTRPPTSEEAFCDLLRDGAQEAARSAGFSFEVIHTDLDETSGARLQRRLRSRGVEGLILLPMADLRGLDALLDWREFSVVSATLSVTSPQFDRVVADHFLNIFNLCDRLRDAGYRRPGLVIHANHDKRCGHSITASHAWHGIYGGVEPIRAHLCARIEPLALKRWLTAQSPDVLLAEHDDLARELQQTGGLTGKLPIVSCSARPLKNGTFPFSGNYDKPREIGAVAVETLARKIAVGQRGIPENPHTTLVRGTWVGGPMPRPRRGGPVGTS
jgi:DNA-binding LacI/PurR family transcriptional regulator